MKNAWRILALLMVVLMVFSLVACGSEEEETEDGETIDLGGLGGSGDTSDGSENETEDETGANMDQSEIKDPTLANPTLATLTVPANSSLKLSTAAAPAEADCQKVTLNKNAMYSGSLILVNSANSMQIEPTDTLANIYANRGKSDAGENTYGLKGSEMELDKTTLDALNAMMKKYYNTLGNSYVLVTDAYRDAETQTDIFENALQQYGADKVGQYALKTNCSDYRTGMAVYFKYLTDGKTYLLSDEKAEGAEQFFNNNAATYGFIQRYPDNKTSFTGIAKDVQPYQYRYVGVPHARVIKEGGYCLEEYIAGIKNYTEENRLKIEDGGHVYHVFYVAAPANANEVTVRIPKTVYEAENYSISGNNVDGFIVTIQLS